MSLIRARYRAVNTIMNLPSGGGYVGLLDLFPNAAAAYSLRKLRAAYSGAAVRVRRSSDNTEQDIGFVANGDLDTTALTTFVNADVDVYTSDFSSTEDLNDTNGTGAAAQSVGGVDDAYKFTCDSTISFHSATTPSIFEVGQVYNVSFKYYIPSGQTIDGIRFIDWGISNQSTLDEWVSVNETNLTSTRSNIRFFAADGTSITPSTNVDGDVFYLKDIIITQTTADGFVTKWYDQSLSNDATQSTAANQPKIVSAGSLVTENGKAAIDFDGAGDSFTTNALAGLTRLDFLYVMQTSDVIYFHFSNTFNYSSYSAHQGSANSGLPLNMGTPTMYNNGVEFTGTTRADVYNAQNGYKVISYIDANTSTWLGFKIGGEGSFVFDGKFQELIVYPSDQSSNRTAIETNINNFYSIY